MVPTASRSWAGSLITGSRDASGLLYRRNRYLDPKTGRFTQEDPIGLAGGLNVYGFGGGDPVSFSDPFGLKADSVKFTGDEAAKLWAELRAAASGAATSTDFRSAFLGALLMGMLDEMEESSTVYTVSAMDYPDYTSESEGGGGGEQCPHFNLCFIRIDTNKTGDGAHIGVLTTLAHEAGGAFLRTRGVNHYSPYGAVMVENFARGIFGCQPRRGHGDSTTPCRH